MRFVYNDPCGVRGAVYETAGSHPVATRERDLPIPVDVYQPDDEIVIEGAIPRARLEDLDLSSEDGLPTMQGEVAAIDRDFAIQEIPRGRFSRTIKVEVAKGSESARSNRKKPEILDAVKGRGYREVALKSGERKGRQK